MAITESYDSETISIDFWCVNCDKIFPVSKRAKLYCSLRCQQDAHLIRYYRACVRDGRIDDPKVREAIIIRLGFANSKKGYYDLNARQLPTELRNKIIERDKGLCRKCGRSGNEIDHIAGDSQDLENLQLLCHECHMEKSLSMLRKLNPEDEGYSEAKERSDKIWLRMNAVSPERACDNSENWDAFRKQIESEQRLWLKKIKEDAEGIHKKEDTFERKIIEQEIDDVTELKSQIESLKLQEKAQIEQILTPEMQAKIDAIKLNFANSVSIIEENIKAYEDRIKKSALKFGASVKGMSLQIVWNKGRETWDPKSLEKYAESHPDVRRV